MKKRLLTSLRQQLIYEIFFVSNVSKLYRDKDKKLDVLDFNYKRKPHQLVLNGKLKLKSEDKEVEVLSYQSLVRGLLQLNG